jgi:CSLREA domain-containing protein
MTFFPLLVGLSLLALCAAGLYQPAARAATTFTVNTTGDGADSNTADGVCNDGGGNCSLRAAIQQANATAGTDTIGIAVNGTINLTGALPNVTSDMTIRGPGSGLLTLRRDTGGDYRVITILSGVTVNVSGLTITNGKTAAGDPGGGIFNSGLTHLTGVAVTANSTGAGVSTVSFGGTGGAGGGVYNAGTLTMANCDVTDNSTGAGGNGPNFAGNGGDGGGVYNSGTLTMTGCNVTGNSTGSAGDSTGGGGTGGRGGGLYSERGLLTLSSVKVGNNKAGDTGAGPQGSASGFGGHGGGIYLLNGTAMLTNSTVSGNSTGLNTKGGSVGYGGGIKNGAALTVYGSTISGNTGDAAGAILNEGPLSMTNSTVSGNHIVTYGGAINNGTSSSSIALTNCTITANQGSGVLNSFAPPAVANTIIAGNNAQFGDANGAFDSKGHNIIGYEVSGIAGGNSFTKPGDQVGTAAAPLDPRLAPLGDNGGPTLTHAPLSNSPALDAGDNALAKDSGNNALTTDQRGAGRFAGPGGTPTVDVGAVEFNPSMEHLSDKTTAEDTPVTFPFFTGDQTINSLTASSDNQTLLPDANISITGTGRTRTVQLTPAADRSGTANVTLNLNGSHEGAVSQTFAFTVSPVNDAPSFTKGADQTAAEDAGPQTVSSWATGISPGPNESSQAVSFQVTADSNAALFSTAPAVDSSGTLTYTTAPNANGSANITLVAKDDGGTTNGGQDTSAPQTFTINVTAVNDPPAAQDQTVSIPEDSSSFIFLTATDPENNSLTFSIVSGPSHGTLSTGTSSTRTYAPAANYVGPDSFTFKATDSLGAESQTATVTINVTAVNDPPVNSVPGAQATDQNTTLVFSAANSNAISVSDIDAGTDPLRVTLTATSGTLTLGRTTGLTFTAGDGADDATMTFAGAIADLNAALDGLAFKPTAGFSGSTLLQITTNDQGSTGAGGARSDTDFVGITVRPGTIEFKQSSYTTSEGAGALAVVVRRTGDTSQAASVAYATDDGSIPSVSVPCSATTGAALDRCDFTKALGRLVFAPGETEKTVSVLVGDDSYVEGTETALIRLSSVSGAGVTLGSRTVATLQITDDPQEPTANPIDETGRFVRQHYHDFLNREPDAAGLAFWTNEIEGCGADAQCREVKRVNVSAAFFLSIEFQETGYLVYRLDKVAFGNISNVRPVPLTLGEFLSDTQSIGQGVVVGAANWQQQLEANKRSFTDAFVLRSRFLSRYPNSTTPESYVDSLNSNAGGALAQEERDALVADLKGGVRTRAQVLRVVAEHPAVARRESNQAFVLMQYFGYLRRDPDSAPDASFDGYNFWLGKLNEFNGDYIAAEMVKAFITSIEYRKRFGQ